MQKIHTKTYFSKKVERQKQISENTSKFHMYKDLQ